MVFAGVTIGVKTEAAIPPNLNFQQNITISSKNLSDFDGFIVEKDENGLIKLLDTDKSDTIVVYNNMGSIMGYVTTEYEYYRVGDITTGDYDILVLFKIVIEPLDKVKYKNGLFDLCTEKGDACLKYVKHYVDLSNNSNIFVKKSLPDSSIITYNESVTIGVSYGYDSDGVLSADLSYERTLSAEYQSVMVENNTSIVNNYVDILYKASKDDDYTSNTNVQYGCYTLNVISNEPKIVIKTETEAQFIIGWGSFWGDSKGKAGTIETKVLNIS